MRSQSQQPRRWISLLLLVPICVFGLSGCSTDKRGQTKSGARMRGEADAVKRSRVMAVNVLGTVRYKPANSTNWLALKTGTWLEVGASVETGPKAHVDLVLREVGTAIRLTEDSELSVLDFFVFPTNAQLAINVELRLSKGMLWGLGSSLPEHSKYLIRCPSSYFDVRSTKFGLRASGSVYVYAGRIRPCWWRNEDSRKLIWPEVPAVNLSYPPFDHEPLEPYYPIDPNNTPKSDYPRVFLQGGLLKSVTAPH